MGLVIVAKTIFIVVILSCIAFALSIAYERSKHTDASGRPTLKALAVEVEPFSKGFGAAPKKAFDRGSLVGISSKIIGLAHGYPKSRILEIAIESGWSSPREMEGPYSTSLKFCKNRLSLMSTKVKNDYWTYGVYWTSDPKSDLYCGSNRML